jgi:cell division protease FtsH
MNQNWNKPDENKDEQGPKKGGMPGCSTPLIVLLLVFAFAPLLFGMFGGTAADQSQISYSQFRSEVEAGNVDTVTVAGERISGELSSPLTRTLDDGNELEVSNFVTFLPTFGDEGLFELLQQNNVELITEPAQTITWWSVLSSLLPFLLLIGIALFFLRRTQNQGENVFLNGKKPGAPL